MMGLSRVKGLFFLLISVSLVRRMEISDDVANLD